VLNQFFQTPHYGNARQLQRVRDLTCMNGRAHDRAQEDVDANGSVGQAVTVGRELCAIVVGYARMAWCLNADTLLTRAARLSALGHGQQRKRRRQVRMGLALPTKFIGMGYYFL
jgi:hypothetical protein